MTREVAHVRNVRATRENWGNDEVDKHDGLCITFCKKDASGQWFFRDVDHVVLTLIASTSITPCHECLEAIADVIRDELDDNPAAEFATEAFLRHHRECPRCTEDILCDTGAELRLVMIDANDGTDLDGSDVDTGGAWRDLRARAAT